MDDIKLLYVKELSPAPYGQKSFYEKARIYTSLDKQTYYLVSYGTIVLSIKFNLITRHWNEWSATTGRHIDAFVYEMFNVRMNKKTYMELPYEYMDRWVCQH